MDPKNIKMMVTFLQEREVLIFDNPYVSTLLFASRILASVLLSIFTVGLLYVI